MISVVDFCLKPMHARYENIYVYIILFYKTTLFSRSQSRKKSPQYLPIPTGLAYRTTIEKYILQEKTIFSKTRK